MKGRLEPSVVLSDDLPPGRRVAYWRRRRGMTQQVFADRLGKSKSWVDKIERGIRRLDKVSVLRQLADVLRVSVSQLTGAVVAGRDRAGPGPEVEAVRAGLTRYEVQFGRRPLTVPGVDELERMVAHAWMSLARADYRRLLRSLPELLCGGQWCRAVNRGDGGDWRAAVLLGQAYQITAEVLQRLGEHHLAWVAADRAMTVSADAGDPLWAARAAIPLATVVREMGRPRQAFEVCLVAAHRLAGPDPLDGAAEYLSVYAALLLHAAQAAATAGHQASVAELLDQAKAAASIVGPGRDLYRTCLGPGLVGVATVAVAVELGQGADVLAGLDEIAADPDHQRLPVALRAAYQIEVARAQLQAGDPTAAGRAVLEAERTATAEVRARPAVREVLGAILRACGQPEPPIARLAEALGVTV